MPRPGAPEPGAHGPDKIYDKFTVIKTEYVAYVPGGWKEFDVADELTHKGEFIFVVRPEADDGAAVAAIEAYADACEETYPGLAAALRAKLVEKGLV